MPVHCLIISLVHNPAGLMVFDNCAPITGSTIAKDNTKDRISELASLYLLTLFRFENLFKHYFHKL